MVINILSNRSKWTFIFYKVFKLILQSAENIYLIQVEQEQTLIYDKTQSYRYKGRLYQVKNILPHNFLIASRSAIINYQKIDHLEVMDGGNIDVIMKNQMRVQISRRKIKDLKERLGL